MNDAGLAMSPVKKDDADPWATPPMFWRPALPRQALAEGALARLALVPVAFWLIDAWRPRCIVAVGGGAYADDPLHAALAEAVDRLGLGAACRCEADPSAVLDGTVELLSFGPAAAAADAFAGWQPKLAATAVVLFATAGPDLPWPRFRFLHGAGLDVVCVGADLPPALAALIDAAAHPAVAGAVRARFACLGDGLAAAARVMALRQRLDAVETAAAAAAAGAEAIRQQLLQAHAVAVENDLARRELKRRSKRITRSWTWKAAKPVWYLEQGVRRIGRKQHGATAGALAAEMGGAADPPFSYGIGKAPYQRWIAAHDRLDADDRAAIRAHIDRLAARPRISVLMPVYNTQPSHLEAAIASVRAQLYPDWELCIVDDASTSAETGQVLAAIEGTDPRIRITRNAANGGIVAASNAALAAAAGDFVTFLDHDDLLAPHALYLVAEAVARHPDAELIYSDEDQLDADGERYNPHFKSGWNPDLLLSQNYICHLAAYRADRVRGLGGLRPGLDGSQDWDLALRVAGAVRPEQIHRLPFILYHWRFFDGHGQFSRTRLAEAQAAGRRAAFDWCAGQGHDVTVTTSDVGLNHVRWPIPDPPPTVSVIVPTRDRVDLLRPCLDGLLQRTDYPALEVIIADNDSAEAETHRFFRAVTDDPRVRVLPCPGPFNYSAINNAGARTARGTVLCLLNNDIEIIGPDWLREMVGHALRPEVGAVGARLLYANTRVQHAGCVVGIQGAVAHAHPMLTRDDPGYFGRAILTQDMSAVTGACLVTRRSCFEAVGGLDAEHLPVAYNDIDYCLKLRAQGYLIVYAAAAELFHHESMSRGYDHVSEEKRQRQAREVALMRARWGGMLQDDPYYNPNLALDQPFMVAFPPRVQKPWREPSG